MIPMTLNWKREDGVKYEYYYGSTGYAFSAQIGRSTNAGKYCWSVFHTDFRYGVWGGEVASVDEAKSEAQKWLDDNAKAPKNENPA